MLKLDNIVKDYVTGSDKVHALNGVSLEFGENEFVSILGQSGCGKTTLLNIIGGLDSCTSGDLIIDGISTKKFKGRDWDTYRNHRIGFVFQTYNLIPHQSVLSNVEIALTLSGVSKKERRKRAIEALINVGLGKQLHKKPNQLSGGQMQRVAIARALVNNPDILLADEPTGALDSETSVQIMELLKEISKNKLIIMVTHNPELANKYSTRIIRLFDGKITDDTNPYVAEEIEILSDAKPKKQKKTKKPSMSRFTALSLSFNNLLTKKARTFLTAFAGSIGIIGIALILSLSNGIQLYINKVEAETLSSYPITVEQTSVDMSGLVTSLANSKNAENDRPLDRIYSDNIMTNMIDSMVSGVTKNNLKDFKVFLDSEESGIKNYASDVQYYYSTTMNIYKSDTDNGVYKVNPNSVMSVFGYDENRTSSSAMMSPFSNTSVFTRLLDNTDVLNKQYETVYGRMPQSYNEVVLIVSKNNEITDYTLYALGIKDIKEVEQMMADSAEGKDVKPTENTEYSYEDMLNLNFKLLLNTDYFVKDGEIWTDKSKDDIFISEKLKDAIDIKVVGIVRPNGDASNTSGGMIGYRTDLMEKLINEVNSSEIVKQQLDNPEVDVFSGLEFVKDEEYTIDDVSNYISALESAEQAQYNAYIAQMRANGADDTAIIKLFESSMNATKSDATYDGNLEKLGVSQLDNPSSVYIYPKDFDAKNGISDVIDKYNTDKSEADRITYTDYVGLILSSVTTIINAISYILIAFVAISLVVSSIMIGVITYISVLERTKEIGILRAMGASKRDISRVFNAETLIVGFFSGAIGIGTSILLIIPINIFIHTLTDISASAKLPVLAGVILVFISMLLTLIAGLIPSKVAAKKDPVVALRTE